MGNLFGRTKPCQAPADGSFTQQQVKMYAVMRATALAAPCTCLCLMVPTACATFMSLQHIAVTICSAVCHCIIMLGLPAGMDS